ncbi:MATE family efflux transporter [Chitinophaga sp. CF418]|uniref:MATE family efflux transporter n=1 Tax=Chitinophaga sp. CF418 TaxID=1855287 RepID=UPI0009233F47|nr:MATE family efflux transporter [Chitinophaga sp. CF418]SHM19134.1 multidrug resistance protein, MATE family [Chitinophaga sp. CF418]
MWTKYRLYYKDNFRLAYPVVISQLGHVMVAFSDTIIIGHTGKVPLAAVALGSSIFSVFMVVGIGMSYGLTPLIAQEHGRKNLAQCGFLLRHSLVINIVLGLLLSTAIITGSNYLHLLGQEEDVRVLTRPFLQLLGISYFPLMIFLTFKQFAEGLGFTRQAMNISIIGNVLNIAVGITLVYGLFGAPRLGVVGVGIGTLTDRVLMAVAMTWYVLSSPRFKAYLVHFRQRYLSLAAIKQILGIGTPVALQYIFEVSAFSSAIVMAGWIGAREQAAHQIAINLASITYMMASGISAAAGIKSGNHFGAGQWRELRSSAIASYHMVLVMMGTTALIFMLGCRLLPLMYINDPAVIDIAADLLIIAAFFQLFDGTQVVGLGILRGLGDVRIPTIITLLAYWVLGLPVGYFLGIYLEFGVQGIWWGLLIGLLTASILLFFRFQHKTRAVVAEV